MSIDHSEAYVRGRVHTNGIENFWACLSGFCTVLITALTLCILIATR